MTTHDWKVKHADEIDTLEDMIHSFMGPKPKKLWLHNNILNMDIPAYFECKDGVIYSIYGWTLIQPNIIAKCLRLIQPVH